MNGQIIDVAPGVRLVQAEDQDGQELWSYVTDWGTIRDVYGFIGAMVCRQFSRRHVDVSTQTLKDEGFTGLYLGMVEYHGQRPIGSHASYHVFRAVRQFLEEWGELRPGDYYATMRLPGRAFALAYKSRVYPISRLAADPAALEEAGGLTMDLFASPGSQPDTSAFWQRLEEVACSTAGKGRRNFDILAARASGVPMAEVANWHGVTCNTANSAYMNIKRRIRNAWDAGEAWGLLHDN